MKHSSLVFAALLLPLSAFAEDATPTPSPTPDTVTLNPIISEGSAAESLKYDRIVPAYSGKTTNHASTGDVSKDIANDLPFHSESNLIPGNETNFTGIGKGPEETDVSMLGIPINRPQGGGVNLGAFPQYFWTGYNYQIGPSLGAFDPRGVGGSLTLRLWTEDAIGSDQNRATALWSSTGNDIEQFSYGWARGDTAILGGLTTGSVFGPGLAFGTRAIETGSFKLTAHLVYADVDAKNFESSRSGATTIEQHTYRLLPVVQADKRFESGDRLKSTLFYDNSYIHYEDRLDPSSKQITKSRQLGNETAYVSGDTRVGFGVRHLSYERAALTFNGAPPSEDTVNAQASRAFRFGTLTIEPTAGGYAVTRLGAYPMASIGARNETRSGDHRLGEFVRVGFTRRAPSLLDRYYQFNQIFGPTTLIAIPNPDLIPENVRSIEAGVDSSSPGFSEKLTFFARDYKHARYTQITVLDPNPAHGVYQFQVRNAGDAYVYGATASADWNALPFLSLGVRGTYQKSRIDDLKDRFPYSPDWVGIAKADLHTGDGKYGLEIVNKAATDFVSYGDSNNVVPLHGYGYVDLFARAAVYQQATLVAGVEDLFDRRIVFRSGFPSEGRVYSLSLQSIF